MPFIPEEKIEEIRERCSIVSIVAGYVSLKKAGNNYIGLCPFHSEKTPSFTVNEDKGIFHCFGCGTGGNAFTFLTRIEGKTFPEVLRDLAEKEGVELPSQGKGRGLNEEQERASRERLELVEVNREAATIYSNLLMRSPEGESVRDYLQKRGIDSKIAREWGLGYGGKGWSSLAGRLADDLIPAAERAGLVLKRKKEGYYDRFRERLIFPISDMKGNVVAFGGRVLEGDGPKYMNSPESAVYTKGKLLYGLNISRDAIRTGGEALVVEGYMDLLTLCRAGISNVVATLGTALTPAQALLIKRFCNRVVLLFDSDEAGLKATVRGIEVLMDAGVTPLVLTLPEGEDPDSFIYSKGADALREKVKSAQPAIDFLLERKLEEMPSSSPHNQANIISDLKPFINKIGDRLEKSLTVKRVAERMSIDEGLILSTVNHSASRLPQKKGRANAPLQKKNKGYVAEEMIVQLMMLSESVLHAAVESGVIKQFVDRDLRAIAEGMEGIFEEGRDISPAQLMNVVEGDGARQKISEMSLRSDMFESVSPFDVFIECKDKISKHYLLEKEQLLKKQLKEAQEMGNSGKIDALTKERQNIIQMRKRDMS